MSRPRSRPNAAQNEKLPSTSMSPFSREGLALVGMTTQSFEVICTSQLSQTRNGKMLIAALGLFLSRVLRIRRHKSRVACSSSRHPLRSHDTSLSSSKQAIEKTARHARIDEKLAPSQLIAVSAFDGREAHDSQTYTLAKIPLSLATAAEVADALYHSSPTSTASRDRINKAASLCASTFQTLAKLLHNAAQSYEQQSPSGVTQAQAKANATNSDRLSTTSTSSRSQACLSDSVMQWYLFQTRRLHHVERSAGLSPSQLFSSDAEALADAWISNRPYRHRQDADKLHSPTPPSSSAADDTYGVPGPEQRQHDRAVPRTSTSISSHAISEDDLKQSSAVGTTTDTFPCASQDRRVVPDSSQSPDSTSKDAQQKTDGLDSKGTLAAEHNLDGDFHPMRIVVNKQNQTKQASMDSDSELTASDLLPQQPFRGSCTSLPDRQKSQRPQTREGKISHRLRELMGSSPTRAESRSNQLAPKALAGVTCADLSLCDERLLFNQTQRRSLQRPRSRSTPPSMHRQAQGSPSPTSRIDWLLQASASASEGSPLSQEPHLNRPRTRPPQRHQSRAQRRRRSSLEQYFPRNADASLSETVTTRLKVSQERQMLTSSTNTRLPILRPSNTGRRPHQHATTSGSSRRAQTSSKQHADLSEGIGVINLQNALDRQWNELFLHHQRELEKEIGIPLHLLRMDEDGRLMYDVEALRQYEEQRQAADKNMTDAVCEGEGPQQKAVLDLEYVDAEAEDMECSDIGADTTSQSIEFVPFAGSTLLHQRSHGMGHENRRSRQDKSSSRASPERHANSGGVKQQFSSSRA